MQLNFSDFHICKPRSKMICIYSSLNSITWFKVVTWYLYIKSIFEKISKKEEKKDIEQWKNFYEKFKKVTGPDRRFSELSLGSSSPRATQPHRSSSESVAKIGPVAGGSQEGGAKR
jgi:hypothetical protein